MFIEQCVTKMMDIERHQFSLVAYTFTVTDNTKQLLSANTLQITINPCHHSW